MAIMIAFLFLLLTRILFYLYAPGLDAAGMAWMFEDKDHS
jgi:hypothetical protein